MRKKKLISRVLVFMLAMIITLTCLPLVSLVAYADNSSGDGDSGGDTVDHGSYSIWQNNTGVRLYLVDASGGPDKLKVVPFTYDGKEYQLLDIWDPDYKNASSTKFYSYYGVRLGSSAQDLSALKITYDTLTTAGLDSPDYVTENGGTWRVNGSSFHDWMTSKSPGKSNTNMSLIMYSFMAGGKADTYKKFTKSYYLIAEPLVCMPAYHDNKYTNAGYRGTIVGTWYDYMRFNAGSNSTEGGSNGGWSAARARSFANGFKLGVAPPDVDEDDPQYVSRMAVYTKYSDFINKTIKDNLGLDTPPYYEGDYSLKAHNEGKYFGGPSPYHTYDYFKYVGNTGWGIQIYWDGEPPQSGKPIDSYDITSNPQPQNIPTPPETPSDENQTSGEKTIIKLYADLYKDPNTSYYTEIIDTAEFVMTNTSNMVTITDEENINGYKLSAWYTSGTKYDAKNTKNNALLKASNMMNISDMAALKSDGKVFLNELGGQQLRINSYQAAYKDGAGYNVLSKDNGGQKYYTMLLEPHGSRGTGLTAQITTGATNYTTYKRLDVIGDSNYGSYEYKVNEDGTVVNIGDAETIVLLYTRERTHISTSDLTSSSTTSDSSTTIDITITDENDDRIDKSGPLTIVKLYGIINPNTYEITADPSKATVVAKNATRNVNINSESGYTFAEWIYTTQGAPTDLTASEMGETNLGEVLLDTTLDQAYRLDGFVDGFKNNINLAKYFRFLNGTTLQRPAISVVPSSSGVNNSATAGRYSYGSRSGIGAGSYNSTLYLGGDKLADKTPDETDTNDILYLLFLKTDQLSYSADDLVIPESYITRYDNYKHNPMTVTGSVSGVAYEEYLQAHKFKYILPVVTTASEYIDVNPLFMPHIAKPSGLYFFAFLQ